MVNGARVRVDNMREVADLVDRLGKTQLLVGIPTDRAPREEGDAHGASRDINNAELGYIHEFGAPEAGVPARPFLRPGVDANRDRIVERMEKAAEAALDGRGEEVERQMQAAGIETVSKIRNRMQAGLSPPLSSNYRRKRDAAAIGKLMSQGRHKEVDAYLADRKPLIDTSQLLRSITWVLRRQGKDDIEGNK